jgi:hypothetical protein
MWKMWKKKKEPQRPERPKKLKEFLSLLKAATFRVSAALFFFIPAVAAFFAGCLLQPGLLPQTGLRLEDVLALLASLLTLLPTALSLTSSTLLKALEEDEKAIKRLAAPASFIIVSFPGNWLAGVIRELASRSDSWLSPSGEEPFGFDFRVYCRTSLRLHF